MDIKPKTLVDQLEESKDPLCQAAAERIKAIWADYGNLLNTLLETHHVSHNRTTGVYRIRPREKAA